MNTEQKAERAAALRRAHTHNCCQAVAAALGEAMEIDPDTLRQLASGFGGGMGSMEGSCGALVGAVMVLGLAKRGEGAVPAARRVQQEFIRRCGAITCKDLKGRDTGVPLCACEDCVRNAVRAYDSVMGE